MAPAETGRSPIAVGVGASAGGLASLKELVGVVQPGAGMALLLVQHIGADHRSLLAELLVPHTSMRVVEAEDGAEIAADTIYVIPPGTAMAVRDGRIALTPRATTGGVAMPVDHLFGSLASEYESRAIGVVLSGAGDDGTRGLRAIKVAGGLTIAQRPADCGHAGMPQSAIDSGMVDLVLPIGEIPAAVARFDSLPPEARRLAPRSGNGSDSWKRRLSDRELRRLADLFEEQFAFGLDAYKTGTIDRRVTRRMILADVSSGDDYLALLDEDAGERQRLLRDLLISVTDFFRDAEAFSELRTEVIDPQIAALEDGEELRVWVAGCATGEEAYSLAIEIFDAFAAAGKRPALQMFGTDVDGEALATARAADYSAAIAERISPERLARYFDTVDGKRYQIKPALRRSVSFALHDLTRDPPLSRMHLVSCRNVLIYLQPETQERVVRLLHYALLADGALLLGPSESPGSGGEAFSTLSKKWRIYRKVGASQPVALARARPERRPATLPDRRPYLARVPARSPQDPARQLVLEAIVPPTIVVGEDGAILFMHGELRPYLRFPQGDARLELSAVIAPELATRTRGAVFKVRREGQTVVAVARRGGDHGEVVRITVRPGSRLREGVTLVTFEEISGEEEEVPRTQDVVVNDAVIARLEAELASTREDLRNTVEELEASNEELMSSNDASRSMNEELQSANEELEATAEELRSLNEELTTVNAQLREKVHELEVANDDLRNFFASTKIATIFLDEELQVKRVTPAARELLSIDDAHLGRPVGDIARELLQSGLEDDARAVLDHLSPVAREIKTQDGRWITREVLPYRTKGRRIEGVVATFVDVSQLKQATERLAVRERQQAMVARIGLHALREPNLQLFLDQLVRDVRQTLDADMCKVLELQPGGDKLFLRAGVGWQHGLVGDAWVGAGMDSQAGFTLASGGPVVVEELSTERRFSGPALLTDHGVVSGLSCPIGEGEYLGVIGVHATRRVQYTDEDVNFVQAVAIVIASAFARQQVRSRLQVEGSLSRLMARVGGKDAVDEVLRSLVRDLDTSVAELWQPRADGSLVCTAMVAADVHEQESLRESFCNTVFARNEGLIGRVMESRRTECCTDLDENGAFVRRDAAREFGLVAGMAFPIASAGRTVGVVALFARHRRLPHLISGQSLEGIGRSIGDFLVRADIEEKARRLGAIVEASQDAVLSYDLDGIIWDWNEGAERMFGFTADEMIGGSVDRFVPDDRRAELQAMIARVRTGERPPPYETVRLHKSGHLLEVSVGSTPIRDAGGAVIGIASTDRDVSGYKDAERRLLAADQQKDEFLAMLGHELRNPLAAIRSAAELVKLRADGDSDLHRIHGVLDRQSAHMASLLDGLLDVSRIIRGKIRLDQSIVDLTGVCRELAEDTRERTEGRELAFDTEITSDSLWINGDRVRIVQLIDNLLANAIKFTPDGGAITLALEPVGGQAVIEVRDTGVGIPPALMSSIFEPFRQAEQELDRAEGGLGLGLALAKSLVELHGGTIEAESEGRDRGTTVTVRLPLYHGTPAAKSVVAETAQPRPARILLVEDNQDAAALLSEVLVRSGHEVAIAPDGEDGVAKARELLPDVIVCDLGLPGGITGLDVARTLRADPGTRDIGLVALTGYGRPEDKEECRQAGFDAHLTKPVDLATINTLLSRLIGPRD